MHPNRAEATPHRPWSYRGHFKCSWQFSRRRQASPRHNQNAHYACGKAYTDHRALLIQPRGLEVQQWKWQQMRQYLMKIRTSVRKSQRKSKKSKRKSGNPDENPGIQTKIRTKIRKSGRKSGNPDENPEIRMKIRT